MARPLIPPRFKSIPADVKRWGVGIALILSALYALPALPWSPVLVTTASVPRGLYLIDKTAPIANGDFIAFAYDGPAWAVERHYLRNNQLVVKYALGLPGDQVVISDGEVGVCAQDHICFVGGAIRATDSLGRPTPAYSTHNYVLADNEYYAGSIIHPKSFDSRYYGPVHRDRVVGKAYPVWTE